MTSFKSVDEDDNQQAKSASKDQGPHQLNFSKLRMLVLESGDRLAAFCQEIALPVTAHESGYSEQISQDIRSGTFNCVLIDGANEHIGFDEALIEVTNNPPFLPVIIVDGSLQFLRIGAAENIASEELSRARLETALFNADRLCKLHNRATHLQSELTALVEEDPLTALPGRHKFRAKMAKVIEQARQRNASASLIILDLDSFKALNESRGHDFGDQVLQSVAKRLFLFAPENTIVGRLGDDEFALLVNELELATPSTTNIAVRLSQELRRPYTIDGQKTQVSATLGIAKLETDDSPDILLHKSMSALYSAKRDKTRFRFYAPEDDVERRLQLRLAQDLPGAIDSEQLRLHYQPMIRMSDKAVTGVEALVRWEHPEKGLLFPDTFIPLSESSGSIEALTNWVLNAAVRQGRQWLEHGKRLSVSVNISALLIHNPGFPETIRQLLETTNFPAEFLKLEITESAIISDVERATEVVNHLHSMGVRISIDDFGTGYTSLAYLRKLPVDEIKIDKSFVMNMNTVADDGVIVRTLLELARNLDLSVVAEGVENTEIWNTLSELGCDVAQGYFMSRPIDLRAFNAWHSSQPWLQELS